MFGLGRGHHGAGAALDMAALGIQRGKTAWVLQVDALVLNAEAGPTAATTSSPAPSLPAHPIRPSARGLTRTRLDSQPGLTAHYL